MRGIGEFGELGVKGCMGAREVWGVLLGEGEAPPHETIFTNVW